MRPRPCSLCGRPADVSAVVLLSTLRISPRRQQSTKAVVFCTACINAFLNDGGEPDDSNTIQRLSDALTPAWNALTRHSDEQSHSKNDIPNQIVRSQSTSGVEAEASCRACVTPCNSRQFDVNEEKSRQSDVTWRKA